MVIGGTEDFSWVDLTIGCIFKISSFRERYLNCRIVLVVADSSRNIEQAAKSEYPGSLKSLALRVSGTFQSFSLFVRSSAT